MCSRGLVFPGGVRNRTIINDLVGLQLRTITIAATGHDVGYVITGERVGVSTGVEFVQRTRA